MTALELVAARLADPRNAWSLGGSGALAEFMRAADEPCERDALQAVTARGAIRVESRGDLGALAYEVPSAQPGLWHHGVLFSLPAAAAVLPARLPHGVHPPRQRRAGRGRGGGVGDAGAVYRGTDRRRHQRHGPAGHPASEARAPPRRHPR